MRWIDKIRTAAAEGRLSEEAMYAAIAQEMADGDIREGLMAKALANTSGDPVRANSLYIKYRLQSLKDELNIADGIAREVEEQLRRDEDSLDENSRNTNQATAGDAPSSFNNENKSIITDQANDPFGPPKKPSGCLTAAIGTVLIAIPVGLTFLILLSRSS